MINEVLSIYPNQLSLKYDVRVNSKLEKKEIQNVVIYFILVHYWLTSDSATIYIGYALLVYFNYNNTVSMRILLLVAKLFSIL